MGVSSMARRNKSSSLWRAFERLVATIEEKAAPRNAIVTSPDSIRDLVTGNMREVDASIRFKAGTTDILVTIECRKRGRKADDTWIEQLATKQQKIGAAKTIAVSSTGFTKSAVKSAQHHGIELRTLSEIKPTEIDDWFLPHGVVHIFKQLQNVKCQLLVEGRDDWIDIEDDLEHGCFIHPLVHTPFSPSTLLMFLEMKQPKVFWAVPLDGTRVRMEFNLDASAPNLVPVPLGTTVIAGPHQLLARIGEEEYVVRCAKLSVDVSFEIATFDSAQGEHHVYKGESGTIAQHTRFSGSVFGLPVTFDHQSGPANCPSASVEFPSGLRLDSNSHAIGPDLTQFLSRMPKGSTGIRHCALCQRGAALEEGVPVPSYLLPDPSLNLVERQFCAPCNSMIRRWDEVGNAFILGIPQDLGTPKGVLHIKNPPYSHLKLWLLSILWRMCVADGLMWRHVTRQTVPDVLRQLLIGSGIEGAESLPTGCVLPSFGGKRLGFSFEPDVVKRPHGALVRVAFAGILFFFSIGIDEEYGTTDQFYLMPGKDWLIPIVEWKSIDFVREWIVSLYGADALSMC
jgi:Restriction endonuclease